MTTDMTKGRTVKTNFQNSWARRTAALGLGLALVGGISLVAAPAQAAPASYSISGTLTTEDSTGTVTDFSGLSVAVDEDPSLNTETAPDGTYSIDGLVDGDYNLTFSAPAAFDPQTMHVTVAGSDTTLDDVVLAATVLPAVPTEPAVPTAPAEPALPALPAGTVSIAGEAIVGNTLTGSSTGWPSGTTLVYSWGEGFGQRGGEIEGADQASYTLTSAEAGGTMAFVVTGSLTGFTPTSVSAFMTTTVTSPQRAAGTAPVADSSLLPAYLTSKDAAAQPQTAAGLPGTSLNPITAYTATVTWTDQADSFVDVYLYSTPTLVGTFAVVGGVVQVPLSATVLGHLAAGLHTLVVVGQTSGSVQSFTVSVAGTLAATGSDVTAPIAIAVLLMLLGGAMTVLRRRRAQA